MALKTTLVVAEYEELGQKEVMVDYFRDCSSIVLGGRLNIGQACISQRVVKGLVSV